MADVMRLEIEIAHARNSLISSIHTRADHPTYGVTKKSLQKRYDELMGMVNAWLYVTGRWDKPATIVWSAELTTEVEKAFGFAPFMLSMRVSAA